MIVSKEKIIQKLRSDGGRAGEGEGERSDRLAASGASRAVQDWAPRSAVQRSAVQRSAVQPARNI